MHYYVVNWNLKELAFVFTCGYLFGRCVRSIKRSGRVNCKDGKVIIDLK